MECAFTSPVCTECGMFVMYCMQCCMAVSTVLLCVDVLSRGGIYILSVYSTFSNRVGLALHNTLFPGVLMKSIGAAFFDRMPFLTSTTCVGCNIK